jgi:hypothetical protein
MYCHRRTFYRIERSGLLIDRTASTAILRRSLVSQLPFRPSRESSRYEIRCSWG